jgi:uridine kinase
VYVDLHDQLCLHRRTVRDVRERGRTPDSVEQQFASTVAPMAARYVRPTIAYADVVVSGAAPIELGVRRILEHYQSRLSKNFSQPSHHFRQ